MKKILYYSDCPFFAGCENMLVNFFGSEELSSEYELTFLYRYSERYEEGAKKRMDMSRSIPVALVSELPNTSLEEVRNKSFSFIRKTIWYLILWFRKYYSIKRNTNILAKEFTRIQPDILHINNGGYPAAPSCYAAVLAAKKCGVKHIVYVVNNMAADYTHPLRWFDRVLDRIVKKQVTYFVNGSNNAGNRLKKVLGIPNSQQVTIRNGIIPRQVTMSREEFRARYGISDDTFVFAEVANLEERKGHLILLQAVQILIKDVQEDFIVLIEGIGPQKENIVSYIENNNLSRYVKILQADQIYNLYNAIDCLILPSIKDEDFPNTVIEAMGMSIPVIGSAIAGIPEQIDDRTSGLLVPPGAPVALADAMKELYFDRTLYDNIRSEAKNQFEKKYTSFVSVRNYIQLYHKILQDSIGVYKKSGKLN